MAIYGFAQTKNCLISITNVQVEFPVFHIDPSLNELIIMSLKQEILPRPAVYSQIYLTLL